MRIVRVLFSLISALLLLTGCVWAEEAAQQPKTDAAKISLPVKVEPNETRAYKLSVHMTGKLPSEDSAKPVDVDASYVMRLQHKYGRRANDGLLSMDISAGDGEATIGGEKLALPTADFPKMTLLIDPSWKIVNLFGLTGTRYAQKMPGLNYSNLIMLFYVPDGASPHAPGESWSGKVKLPGADECTVKTTLKSFKNLNSTMAVTLVQEYTWPPLQIENGSTAVSKADAESTFALDTGKLLASHVESQIIFRKSTDGKQDQEIGRANTKIDVSLEK